LFQDGDFKDLRAKIANMTAAVTGIRAGELLGLQRKNVKPGYLEIHKSWNQMTRRLNESTKTGRGRDIPIPTIIQQALAGLMDQSPWQEPDDFVFTSTLRHAPMDGKVATHGLYEALESIGISKQMRKDRWIDFHSWRHWLNSTLINQRIPINKVMSITGHLTSEMTKNYYHPDDMRDERRLQEKLICMSQKKPG
jgi:integrase